MLPDYKQNLTYTPLRFRHVHDITITATIASGVATLLTAESSPQTTIVQNGTGRYDVTLPKGLTVCYANGIVEKTAGAPAVSDGNVFSFGALVATAGAFSVFLQRSDTGAAANPPDGKLRLRLELGKM